MDKSEEKNQNTSLLNKKRNNKKKFKDFKENISTETTLEIKLLTNNTNKSDIMEEEEGEIKTNEKNNGNNDSPILLIKKTLINFNTEESKFQKGRKNPQNFPEEEKSNSYYVQRYYFFSLFDKGIQMDKESWYSVTPEEISEYISSIIPDSSNSCILDGFCGCGGNIIYFSKYFKKVIANDLFEQKINMTKHNVRVYDCPDNIEYFTQDYFDLNLDNEKIDYIFLSPPWGGPEYKKDKIYSLKKWINPDIEKIIEKSLKFSKNLIFYLPRNTDLEELAFLLNKYDKAEINSLNNTILLDVKYLNSASKIKAILILYGPKFNLIKVKLIREFVINTIFRKNSNKVNEIKIKKQINILKVVGYSKYIKTFLEFKEMKKDFSGNNFLEILEKYFLNKIMETEEIEEYEKLCKLKSINYNENEDDKEDNIINTSEYENKINIVENDVNEFVDLREILTEEQFNKVKQQYIFNDNK